MAASTILYGDDGKLRSGWRFAIFVFSFLVLVISLGIAAMGMLAAAGYHPGSGGLIFPFANSFVMLAASLTAGWLCAKYLESLPYGSLGASPRKNWLLNFAIGIFAGALTFAFGALIAVIFGGLSFSPNLEATFGPMVMTLSVTFVFFAVSAAWEEAVFRGYLLQTLIRSELTLFGVLLTSALFATVHNSNPSASLLSWTNTFIAGIWFSVAYLKTRDLWFPTGLHLAWNWTQGSIFGVEVSGLTELVKAPLMRESDFGPTWLTGGDYGIEGGIVTTIALTASTILIYFHPLKTPEPANPHSSEFQL